ncbi:MAG TPA: 3',5'-nucleoside bisphosphate phosphatase [Gammaproteobacteria bacterium]|nr:3',5'-nucleoside bisphosphate phosphatase [Gammaproteobacteria bacterium]
MTLHYDLHSHSTASDGTLSPAGLVARAHARSVHVLALTDHDSTEGLAEAAAAAAGIGLDLIPGVEISVSWNNQTLHIIGLHIDPENQALQQGLTGLRVFRDWRAQEIARRLEKHGIADTYEGAKAYAKGSIVGRTHFARLLVERGEARDLQQVFKRFLVHGKPGYVSGEWAKLEDAVSWITGAGGQAVIAHPARYKLTATRLRMLFTEFKDMGGAGIEVVSGSHSRDDYFTLANYAKQFGLLASSGSDYHGPEHPWIELGRLPELPKNCVPIWTEWRQGCL